MMAEFVSHNHFDFFGRVRLDQGVGDDDSARASPTGYGCVGFGGLVSQMPNLDALYVGTDLIGECEQSILELALGYRFELVKQWQ